MSIRTGSLEGMQTANLWQMTRTNLKTGSALEGGVVTAETSLASQRAATLGHVSTTNMLSGNFVDANYERSQYLSSTLNHFKNEKNFANSMDSMLSAMTAQFGLVSSGMSKYAAAYIMQRRVEEGVGQVVQHEFANQSENNLTALKENIDQQAEGSDTASGPDADSGQPTPAAEASPAVAASTESQVAASVAAGSDQTVFDQAATATVQPAVVGSNVKQASVDVMV